MPVPANGCLIMTFSFGCLITALISAACFLADPTMERALAGEEKKELRPGFCSGQWKAVGRAKSNPPVNQCCVYNVKYNAFRLGVLGMATSPTRLRLQPHIMPPLPSTLGNDTFELISSAQRRQKDLSEFQLPRLRACHGPLTVQQNLAAELREDIEAFARQVEVILPYVSVPHSSSDAIIRQYIYL
jgi:hypothetical protein